MTNEMDCELEDCDCLDCLEWYEENICPNCGCENEGCFCLDE